MFKLEHVFPDMSSAFAMDVPKDATAVNSALATFSSKR